MTKTIQVPVPIPRKIAKLGIQIYNIDFVQPLVGLLGYGRNFLNIGTIEAGAESRIRLRAVLGIQIH